MKTKKGLTIERHKAIGAELKTINQRLGELFIEIAGAYPLKIRAVLKLDKADKALMCAGGELEEQMFRDHPCKAHPWAYFEMKTDGFRFLSKRRLN